VSCPPGYTLSSGQCQFCPAAFYCLGGSIQATPCGADMFAMPGAQDRSSCFPAVFVIIKVALPILRQEFRSGKELRFQKALASVIGADFDLVLISGVIGDVKTLITSSVATMNVNDAAYLFGSLKSMPAQKWSEIDTFVGASLISIQVTGCKPGLSLDANLICQLCPANYYCIGGSASAQPCPMRAFSMPGANSSNLCQPAVFVIIEVSLSISRENFTSVMEQSFQTVLSVIAGVSPTHVVVMTVKTFDEASTDISSEIAADDVYEAHAISRRIDSTMLNRKLVSKGLPGCTLKSVTVTAGTDTSSGISSLAVMVVSIAGGVTILLMISIFKFHRRWEQEDERLLRHAADSLRIRLGIRMKDGFFLNTETVLFLPPILWKWLYSSSNHADGPTIIHRSYLEAAACLSILQVNKVECDPCL
jgi:hypothetical protein